MQDTTRKQSQGENGMGHKFMIAAFCCTWTIQFGYLILLVAKWNRQRRQIALARVGTAS